MRKRLIDSWVEALRSGEYMQGKYRLKQIRGNGSAAYCCLGVAAELFAEEFGIQAIENAGVFYFGEDSFRLPAVIRAATGITLEQEKLLIHLNDIENYSFTAIADQIEENVQANPGKEDQQGN